MAKQALQLQSWDDIRVFLAIIKTGSFSLAASELKTEQSTVSRRLANLEEQLGATLFERTRRGARPTEFAALLTAGARRIEAEMHKLSDAAFSNRDISGRVRIAMTESLALHFVIPRIVPNLLARYPKLSLELITGDHPVDLESNEADLALRFMRTTSGNLVTKRIGKVSLAVLGPRSQASLLSELDPAKLDWIGCSQGNEARWLTELGAGAPKLLCSTMEGVVAAIRAGLGVGIAPAALVSVYPDLAVLPVRDLCLPAIDLFIVTRAAIRKTALVNAVWSVMSEELRKLGAGSGATAEGASG